MEQLSEEERKKMGLQTAKTHIEFNLLPMLEEAYGKGIIDFSLRMFSPTSFYIHPTGKDGQTINIEWTPPPASVIDVEETPKETKGISQSVKDHVAKMMSEIRVDIDVEYCKKHNIKFKDTPETLTEDELWNRLADSKRTKAVFDYVMKLGEKNKKKEE